MDKWIWLITLIIGFIGGYIANEIQFGFIKKCYRELHEELEKHLKFWANKTKTKTIKE